jgi:hypothetical protein
MSPDEMLQSLLERIDVEVNLVREKLAGSVPVSG